MQQPTPAPDPYRRRRAAGAASRQETRRRLLAAADELFRRDGYGATTVTAIAALADVSLQTLYLAWGSKRALLRAATDAAAAASSAPPQPQEWRSSLRAELTGEAGTDPTAAEYLAAVSRLHARVAERTAPYWRMHRQGAATDPEIAADWEAIQAGRRQTLTEVTQSLPRRGRRPDLSDDDITDTLWALTCLEVYDILTEQGRRSLDDFQSWLDRTLVAALCEEPAPSQEEPAPSQEAPAPTGRKRRRDAGA